jgi:hypothetical protein
MGVLEDAIREHLELKRQHGASDEEVEREQTEALGPARGADPDQPQGDEPEAAEPVAQEQPEPIDSELDEAPAALDISEPAAEPEPEPAAPADFAADFDEPEPATYDDEPEPVAYDDEPEPVAFDEDEPGVAPPMPGRAEEPPEQPPEEVAEVRDEDVLQDTPDFLQDTPEHDRLWFEQKPPRDFDFD